MKILLIIAAILAGLYHHMEQLFLNNPKANICNIIQAAKDSCPDNIVLAQLSATQAILESGLRERPSKLALEGNNLFGIKGRGTDGSIALKTTEYVHGKAFHPTLPFAKNKTLKDSFDQHKALMYNGTKDNPNRYKGVVNAKTFEEAAQAVAKAGYATDPHYTQELIEVYNQCVKGKL